MNAPELLDWITAAGVRLSARGGNIVVSPRSAVTPEVLNLIRAHKGELLAVLSAQPASAQTAASTNAPDERSARGAGAAQAELIALVNRVADHHGFTTEQRREALDIAHADHVAALECFRALAVSMSIPDAAEARRQRVLAMLDARPGIRYAVVVDNPDTDPVLVTVAIRGVATFELAIPAAKFDPFLLLDLMERHGGTMH